MDLSGSASLYGFALGVMAASLAFVTFSSQVKLRTPWRPAGAWQHTVKRARNSQQRARLTVSRRSTAAASPVNATPPAGTPSESSRPYADVTEPADLAQLVKVLPRADEQQPPVSERPLAGPRKREPSRLRQRVNAKIDQVLSDEAATEPVDADESFWGPRGSRTPAGYRSKHRLPESGEPSDTDEPPGAGQRGELEQPKSHRRSAPRHAAS
jgi:hypothetical protein